MLYAFAPSGAFHSTLVHTVNELHVVDATASIVILKQELRRMLAAQ